MVPLSEETMASSFSSLLSVCVTTCGFIGMSLRVPRSSISSFQSFMRSWRLLQKFWLLALRRGSSAVRMVFASPTRPTSTWMAQAQRESDRFQSAHTSLAPAWEGIPCTDSWCRS